MNEHNNGASIPSGSEMPLNSCGAEDPTGQHKKETDSPSNEDEILRTLLEQNWGHCQHLESERAWFMNIYAAITAALLAFAFHKECKNELSIWIIFFIMLLTLFGFLQTIRWIYAFETHRTNVNELIRILKSRTSQVSHFLKFDMSISPMTKRTETNNATSGGGMLSSGLTGTRLLFPCLYLLIFIILSFISLHFFPNIELSPFDYLIDIPIISYIVYIVSLFIIMLAMILYLILYYHNSLKKLSNKVNRQGQN